MSEMTILIIDDEQQSIDILSRLLSRIEGISQIHELLDPRQVMDFLTNNIVDLVFLDIDMPYISGLKLGEEIKKSFPSINFIFVTGHTDYALYGYELYPIDFLIKPVNPLRLEKAMSEYIKKKNSGFPSKGIMLNQSIPKKISVRNQGSICFIQISEINFVEKNGRKCIININDNQEIECNNTLTELERMLSRHKFFRPHQSFLIPISKISEIKPDEFMRSYVIEIKNVNADIRVSKNRYSDLKKIILDNL